MGLDAGVRCRCWEKGLCAPTRLKSHIQCDAEEGYLSIDLPWETHKKEVREFNQWVQRACAHPGMFQAVERISNWAGVRAFQHALRTIDKQGFQNLLREIPDNNGGLTSPEVTKHCLQELDRFGTVGSFGRYVQLIDSDTGSLLTDRIEAYDGWFMSGGSTGYQFSLESDGHLRIDHAELGTVFRAKEVAQNRASDGQFIYTNLVDGSQYVCPVGIRDYERSEHPLRLRGVVGSDSTDRYAAIVGALRRVFAAAIEMNHPVSWF